MQQHSTERHPHEQNLAPARIKVRLFNKSSEAAFRATMASMRCKRTDDIMDGQNAKADSGGLAHDDVHST